MDVSKSEPEIYQGKRIGRRRNLSRYRNFLISRKLSRYSLSVGFFTLGIQIFDSLEIYQGEERGQFQMPLIFANGPAVGFSKRYPTQHPGRVQLPRASGARKLSRCKKSTAQFLPSGYKFYRSLRVSRYKFNRSRETVKILLFY